MVAEAEEGLTDKVRGESDAGVELEGRFEGVERVVVVEDDAGDEVGVGGGGEGWEVGFEDWD